MHETAPLAGSSDPEIFIDINDVRDMLGAGDFASRTHIDRPQKELHFSEVLPLAEKVAETGQLKRGLGAIALDIINHCDSVAPGSRERVLPSVDSFFAERESKPLNEEQKARFLLQARRSLPTRHFRRLQELHPEVFSCDPFALRRVLS
jgi:hypothetical protein